MCIEVLLSHAQGDYDILREANAKGETPLDIANALGDTSLILRSGRAARGGGRACSEGGVDIERIMAVWERFFENAAVACVGGQDTARATGASSRNQHGQLQAGHHRTTVKTLEASGRVKWNDQPATAREPVNGCGVVTTARGGDAKAEAERNIRRREEERGWNEGKADIPRLATGTRGRQLSRLLPGTPAEERSRVCAWEAAPLYPVGDQEGKRLGDNTRQQQRATEQLDVQLENEAPVLLSDDVDLHLFQTPRGDSDAEVVWLSESHQGKIRSTPEPAAEHENSRVAATAAGSSFHLHHTWVACWDATSESIYYWDSESGELSWDAPAPTGGVHEFQSCVWDPQRDDFFTVDESGTSHWLTDATVEGRAATDDATSSAGTTVASVEVANYGRADSGSAGSTSRLSWQGFGSAIGTVEDSPSVEAMGFGDNLHATTILGERKEHEKQNLRSSPYLLAEAVYQPVGQLPDVFNGYDYPGEQSSNGVSNVTPQGNAGQGYEEVVRAVGEERPSSLNTAAAPRAIQYESAGEEDRSDGVEFFDSRTCEHDFQLSMWVWWSPSHQDGDGPPYFVNEETGESSWVLPPEAVATSGGWLRAWSEQHQAWFYANQWTGRVTWELQDLEAEGGG